MPITPYGNAEAGDYPALFSGCFEAKYPKGIRLLFGFAILNQDRETPYDGPEGEGLYAVAVCNKSEGTNPKSKPFKIRRAMLQAEEFRDPQFLITLPPWEHFTERYNGRLRVLDIRVVCPETDGRRLSLVTHICRPRDGVWQEIEGVYEGGAPGTRNGRPFWLEEDGRAIPYDDARAVREFEAGRLQRNEALEWSQWNLRTRDRLGEWFNPDGSLRELAEAEIAALGADASLSHQIAHRRAALGFL